MKLEKPFFVEESKISARLSRLLYSFDLFEISKLEKTTKKYLLSLRGMGKNNLNELRSYLASVGTSLKDDILISDEGQKEFILSIPSSLIEMKEIIHGLKHQLTVLSYDLDTVITECQKRNK
jgi:hypothetical protein